MSAFAVDSFISDSPEWKSLEGHVSEIHESHLRDLMHDESRCAQLVAQHDGIILDYSRQRVQTSTMDMLISLAERSGIESKRGAMAAGEHINSTENRAVMHTALRAPRDVRMTVDGADVVPQVHEVLDRIKAFSDKVRDGSWLGVTGKRLTSVISIGIGGSYLGPEFVYEALRTDKDASERAKGRNLRFLANVDPVDFPRATADLDPETTLVIIISKTFTTAETMLNAKTARLWLLQGIKKDSSSSFKDEDILRQHMIAVSTANKKAEDFGVSPDNIFGFWDWVGGRYSVCSAVGILPLALHYSFGIAERFLAGAHNMDRHFFEAPLRSNLPVIMALLGVWNASFLKYPCRAILPYSQALTRFAAHIQQVDMESNGKRVSKDGRELPYECGEVIFGEPGTNGQHSFYQLIHQGRVIPAEFIGFMRSPHPISVAGEPVSNHDELMSNFFAQPDALAYGKTISELVAEKVPLELQKHKEFPGNRPSLSLLFPELTAYTCGQLLSLYENRIAAQGFIWDVNSFDQWGVELGKVLANKVRAVLQVKRSSLPSSAAEVKNFNSSTEFLLKSYLAASQDGAK